MLKILAIGDLHFRDHLGYAELVSDQRVAEREAVFDKLIESANDCDLVVLMGDVLNSRTNSAETLRRLVVFLERFGDKKVFILGGNHDGFSSGKNALDFLREIKNKPWRVVTDKVLTEVVDGHTLVFLPYFTGPQLMDEQCRDWPSASAKLMASLPDGDMLFAHHAITGTFSDGIPTESFEEVLLPMETLLKKYKTSVAGHIHSRGVYAEGRVVLTGSSFTDCVGEDSKSTWKFSLDAAPSVPYEEIPLPVRPIIKLENPTAEALAKVPANAIVKMMVTEAGYNVEPAKKVLTALDGHVIVEQVVKERTRDVKLEGGELNIDNLLKAYARQRNVDLTLLLEGFALIQ